MKYKFTILATNNYECPKGFEIIKKLKNNENPTKDIILDFSNCNKEIIFDIKNELCFAYMESIKPENTIGIVTEIKDKKGNYYPISVVNNIGKKGYISKIKKHKGNNKIIAKVK